METFKTEQENGRCILFTIVVFLIQRLIKQKYYDK